MLALLAVAFAGIPEDLASAADTNLPTGLRQEALGRMVRSEQAHELVRLAERPDGDKAERWVAIRALGPMATDDARTALLHYLEADDASTRMAALGALGDRKDRALAGRVAASLADKALLVRAAAADALARLGEPSTLPELDRALADPSNTYRGTSLWVRRRYVEAIGAIGTDAAVPMLARALEDGDAAVATAAISGLERVAGFSYTEGRTADEEREAWRRWSGR